MKNVLGTFISCRWLLMVNKIKCVVESRRGDKSNHWPWIALYSSDMDISWKTTKAYCFLGRTMDKKYIGWIENRGKIIKKRRVKGQGGVISIGPFSRNALL